MKMAPSAETRNPTASDNSVGGEEVVSTIGNTKNNIKNVTVAVNYELPMVHQFLPTKKRKRRSGKVSNNGNLENDAPNVDKEEETGSTHSSNSITNNNNNISSSVNQTNIDDSNNSRRVSMRDKQKKETPITRTRVRYDMQFVPIVQREAYLNEEEADSVLWIPNKRAEWEDCISEMTSLCTQAALRKHDFTSKKSKPFVQPLSREYIRDRVDIDDPLNGYQIRHKTGGWLQGFVLFTNFTTWTHGFHWDSTHPAASSTGRHNKNLDKQLAAELEAQPRSGDPRGGGIVFDNLAEIALVGGLGCGGVLLRIALTEILQNPKFKYVVLQATEQSKSFYEKFGFVRVGAICQYGDGPVVGYRHWTHANESEKSLQKHGGPSYMMCLKLEHVEPEPILFDQMMSLKVDAKPTVEQIGNALPSTPGLKFASKRSQSMPIEFSSSEAMDVATSGNNSPKTSKKLLGTANESFKSVGRPPTNNKTPRRTKFITTNLSPIAPANRAVRVANMPKRAHSSGDLEESKPSKRLRIEEPASYEDKQSQNEPEVPYTEIDSKPSEPQVKTREMPLRRSARHPRSEAAASSAESKPSSKNEASSNLAKEIQSGKPKTRSTKVAAQSAKSTTTSQNGKVYHSVRGPDGKFIRVAADGTVLEPKKKRKTNDSKTDLGRKLTRSSAPVVIEEKIPEPPMLTSEYDRPSVIEGYKQNRPRPIDKKSFKKQKVKSYPRSRIHFYNRVVKKKGDRKKLPHYYFVVEYDEEKELICIVRMSAKGTLLGRREGRPRYQCQMEDTDACFQVVSANDYDVVRSVMVMKTPIIALEAWDIETPDDKDFMPR